MYRQTPDSKQWLLALQHVFAMFGATVLVPFLTGLDTLVALFCAGVGTLIFHLCTKGKVPVFLGSSFAFIAAIIAVATRFSDGAAIGSEAYQAALPYVSGGIICAGALYLILAALVKIFGVERITSFFPPVVVGPMIIVIGLTLAPTAIANITDGGADQLGLRWLIALLVIATVIAVSSFAKGFFKLVPILIAMAVGYVFAALFDLVDFAAVSDAAWLAWPKFTLPKFNWEAISMIAPLAIVTFMEHIGDITTNSSVVGKNFLKNPGLHRTLVGDGLATMLAGALGGPANTTYSENTGVLAVTKNYDPVPLRLAAGIAIVMSLVAKLGSVFITIPAVVMGAVSVILFGMIASIGIRTLAEAKVDYTASRNLVIIALMLVIGLGGVTVSLSETFQISGMALAALMGIVLNKVIPAQKK